MSKVCANINYALRNIRKRREVVAKLKKQTT